MSDSQEERKASMIAAINDGIDRIEDIKFIEQVYAMVVVEAAKKIQKEETIMSKEKFEMKLEERLLKVEKLSKTCADILENITDESSVIKDSQSNEVIATISGKLDFVINELTEMKKDAAYIELVERNRS